MDKTSSTKSILANKWRYIFFVANSVLEVSRGIATLIHILDPPAVIVGGGIMEQEWLVSRIALNIRRSFQLSWAIKQG
ncbi:ROK family protein [Paenibacillus taichungensis]|uniref:ROK family protein n=1 Tax=Paenibacillus taichungensis TaxID=484184 RepID=UPI0039A64243